MQKVSTDIMPVIPLSTRPLCSIFLRGAETAPSLGLSLIISDKMEG